MIYLFIIVFSYCLSNVIDEWLNPKMVLNWYYNFLLKIGKVETDEQGNVISAKWFIYPIGFCKICTNVWLSVFIIAISLLFTQIQPIWIVPTIIASNFLVIKF